MKILCFQEFKNCYDKVEHDINFWSRVPKLIMDSQLVCEVRLSYLFAAHFASKIQKFRSSYCFSMKFSMKLHVEEPILMLAVVGTGWSSASA